MTLRTQRIDADDWTLAYYVPYKEWTDIDTSNESEFLAQIYDDKSKAQLLCNDSVKDKCYFVGHAVRLLDFWAKIAEIRHGTTIGWRRRLPRGDGQLLQRRTTD